MMYYSNDFYEFFTYNLVALNEPLNGLSQLFLLNAGCSEALYVHFIECC